MYKKLSELKNKLEKELFKYDKKFHELESSIIFKIKLILSMLDNDDLLNTLKDLYSIYKTDNYKLYVIPYNECVYINKCTFFLKNIFV